MVGTRLDADTAGPLHLIDLVRSLVRSEDIFSVEHEADWFPSDDDGENGCSAGNGRWVDSLMQPPTRLCLEERSPQREASRKLFFLPVFEPCPDAGPGPLQAAVALKHQLGPLHNPNVLFDFSWSAGLSNDNAAPLVERRGCSVSKVQVLEHVISDEALSSNTATQPSLLPPPLDPVPGAGQRTPTLSSRSNCRAPQRFTRAAVVRTLLVSPNTSPSRCTSPLQLRNDAHAPPSRCASPLQLKHRRGVGKRKPRGLIASTRAAVRFTEVRTGCANIATPSTANGSTASAAGTTRLVRGRTTAPRSQGER